MTTRSDVRDLLARHDLHLKRSMGQSFLVDDGVLRRIAETATGGEEPLVVEIGTGLGTLTRALAAQGKPVVTIEHDRKLVPVLREIFPSGSGVHVVEADALEVVLADVARDATGSSARPAIAGNLPYSITSPLILALLAQRAAIGLTTIMIQREVADRLLAEPGTKAYGSLTVLLRLYADIEHVFDVPPESFLPAPKVFSSVLRLRFLDQPRCAVADADHFQRVVRAAFSTRRKTLRNSLRSAFDRDLVEAAAARAEIVLERRGETLTLNEFARLAEEMAISSAI